MTWDTNGLQCRILQSRVFTFVVGSGEKHYSVHEAAFSQLSEPLNVMLNGSHKEARTTIVDWPDVDDHTFVRFTQWAYTRSYAAEEPDIILDQSSIELSSPINDKSGNTKSPEQAMYSLQSWEQRETGYGNCCGTSAYAEEFSVETCRKCGSTVDDCHQQCTSSLMRKRLLIQKFLDKDRINFSTTTSAFEPRINKESCEDYTGVFLCHAKLYVLGDVYDMPQLRRLALHRLHATLKAFVLYPSRLKDIAVLARYIFENTQSHDKIREMIVLYYACIIEDVLDQDGLESVIDDVPEFAYILIKKVSERLA